MNKYSYDRTSAEKVWVYIPSVKQFKQMDRTDPKLQWDYPHSPKSAIRMTVRGKSEYVYAGTTKEEAAEKVNQYDIEKVAELEKQIEAIRAHMVKP